MAEHISQKEAAALERTVENSKVQTARKRYMLSEIIGAGGAGLAIGYVLTKNPSMAAGFGPGKRIKLDHVVALAGLFLGRKTTRIGAIARGAGLGSVNQIGREYGIKAATP
jgi:hypothetical protein